MAAAGDGGTLRERGEVLVASPERWAETAASLIAGEMRRAVDRAGRCALALAGGSTPGPAYRELRARGSLDWSSVHVYFGDERGVPPDHPESNYRMARKTLLEHVDVPAARVHRMEAERPDRWRAAEEYAGVLPGELDLLLLGIGEDGHTASLFPGSPALAERDRRVVPVEAPEPPVQRLTVTPPVVGAARRIVVLATGREKAEPVARALAEPDPVRDCPSRLARGGTWMLDGPAADRAREVREDGSG